MKGFRFSFMITIMFLLSLGASAKTVKDTLLTTDGDRIIITYELSLYDDCYTIKFCNQQKKMGRINGGKYAELDKVAVMFFDRTGGFSSNVSITNMVPEAFMVPSNVKYERSSDGFFLVHDNPTLNFIAKGSSDITIPIYLAYHPKKGKYILFSKCKGMNIHLTGSTAKQQGHSQSNQKTSDTTIEIEPDNTEILRIMESINLAKGLLDKADELPFSDNLEDEIQYLRSKRREIADAELRSQIDDVLQMREDKKKELENKASAEQIAEQKKAEERAKREAEKLQAKQDSIMAAQQAQAEEDKKKDMLMKIGCAVLAMLAFAGYQVLQNRRNAKNRREMLKEQEAIAKKAEEEAKRRANNAGRKTNQTLKPAKNSGRDAARKNTIRVNGKSKDLSI